MLSRKDHMNYRVCAVQRKKIKLCPSCYQRARKEGTIRMRPKPQHPQIVRPPINEGTTPSQG